MLRKREAARAAVAGLAGLLALGARPALATATLSCEGDDKSLKFSLQAVVSHGMGESLSGFQGELEVRLKGTPEDFRRLPLTGDHLTQHWIYGREVKLRMYRERDGSDRPGHVELVVETRAVVKDEPEHRGTYVLTVHTLTSPSDAEGKTLKARGRATCSVG